MLHALSQKYAMIYSGRHQEVQNQQGISQSVPHSTSLLRYNLLITM